MSDRVHMTFATWLYVLYSDGVHPRDAGILDACAAVRDAQDEAAGEAAGADLVLAVRQVLEGDAPAEVGAAARQLFGDRVMDTLQAGTRADRMAELRRRQFESGLPWLAWVYERRGDGSVTPDWLIVERVDQQVYAMDPDPWDGIDEERVFPMADFHVLWELGGCQHIRLG